VRPLQASLKLARAVSGILELLTVDEEGEEKRIALLTQKNQGGGIVKNSSSEEFH